MASEITVTLSGSESEVQFAGANAWLRNDGAATIYAAKAAGVTAGADGVVAVPAGGSAPLYGANGRVFLLGTGSVQLIGSDYSTNPFKTSTASGGSAVDEVARAAINAHAGNAEIHVTAAERAAWNGKADVSDIPTALPANGGNADTLDGMDAGQFLNLSATDQLTTSINERTVWGVFSCEVSYTPDFPTGYGNYGYLVVTNYGSICYQTMLFENGDIIHRAKIAGQSDWTAWQRINDGGNADTVGSRKVSTYGLDGIATINQDYGVMDIGAIIDFNTAPEQDYDGRIARDDGVFIFLNPDNSKATLRANLDGSAASVGVYTEDKLAALEARVAALEGGT